MKKIFFAIALVLSLVATINALAQGIVNPNNTVVRFVISTGGTNLGTIDIELFNAEKPETVNNFLMYVYSGAYSNLVLNRLVPNFVVQAGRVKVADPDNASAFNSYIPGPNFGPIANEYSVGPQLSNTFGTIAMARIPGLTNSASAEWFINSKDNAADLDGVDGGFTVFGHIVNTSGTFSGTNFLNHLNTFSYGNGLTTAVTSNPSEGFFELPISIPSRSPVLYRDLFAIDAFVLQNGRTPERNPPAFTLNEPAGDLITTNATVRFSGTTGDDTGVARITFEEDTYDFRDIGLILPGAENWSFDFPLTPGTNHITVRSIDAFGNESARERRTIFYSLKQPFTLQVEGPGKVKGLTNGQILEVGVNYPLSARPLPGKYFLNWSGIGFSTSRNIVFRMTENGSLTAKFATTFLGLTKGKYDGLFFAPTNGPRRSLGRLTLNLSASGVYSGRLSPMGASYAIRGRFKADGTSEIKGQRGTDLLVLNLQLVIGEGVQGILVTYSDGHSESEGALFHVPKYSATNPAPSAGRYTFLVYPSPDTNILAADAYSFGSMNIDDRGRITMSGSLADGTAIKQKTSIVDGERWPLIALAYKKKGGLVGFGQFSSNGVFNSIVRWFSPEFPGGTNQLLQFAGSPYVPPTQARLFNWTNGVVTLSGDDLPAPINTDVILNEEGSFTVLSNPNNIQLTIPDDSGLFTGSFTHPVTQTLTPLRGAVLQSSNIAAGFFGVSSNNGAVLIRAQ